MRNKLKPLRRLLFEMWVLTRRFILNTYTYLSDSWVVAWKTIFGMGNWIVSLLFNKQIWFVTVLVLILWSLTEAPSLLGKITNLERWGMSSCDFQGVRMFVNYPIFVAPGDQRKLEITMQNKDDKPLTNIQLSITSPRGLLLFEDANYVSAETLKPNEAITEKLRFRIAKYEDFEQVPVVVAYQTENEDAQYCSQPPVLSYSRWRRTVVRLKALPDVLDIVATSIGYLGTLLTGLLAIRGKIGPVVKEIVSILRANKNTHNLVDNNGNSA